MRLWYYFSCTYLWIVYYSIIFLVVCNGYFKWLVHNEDITLVSYTAQIFRWYSTELEEYLVGCFGYLLSTLTWGSRIFRNVFFFFRRAT